MPRTTRWLIATAVTLPGVLVLALGAVYAASELRLRRTQPHPTDPDLVIPTDSTAIRRGAHLARVVAGCVDCHGADLGGAVYADAGPVGIVAGPNLTRGAGGIAPGLQTADWVRAIRRGVRPDARSLIVMPSETFVHLSRGDLAALIAYVRSVPPVDRTPPVTHFRLLGRALLATGRLPILVAEKTPDLPLAADIPPGPTAAYGRYLADVSGCRGCHGLGLSGGRVAGPPGTPPTPNLTPAGAIGSWTEDQFVRAMRAGTRPDGSTMDPFMPWPRFAGMSAEELHAIWLYLQSVPAREYGHR